MAPTAAPTETTRRTLPEGNWHLDATHSTAGFAVRHMVVATFRGRFEHFDATLAAGEDGATRLEGTVDATSLRVKDENLQAHLEAPDFFDVERYPEIRFVAEGLRRSGDQLTVDGHLTIKDHTHPLQARGEIRGPATTLGDQAKLGISLETIIDRNAFGLEWNAPLPRGGVALADEVRLTVELELVRSEV